MPVINEALPAGDVHQVIQDAAQVELEQRLEKRMSLLRETSAHCKYPPPVVTKASVQFLPPSKFDYTRIRPRGQEPSSRSDPPIVHECMLNPPPSAACRAKSFPVPHLDPRDPRIPRLAPLVPSAPSGRDDDGEDEDGDGYGPKTLEECRLGAYDFEKIPTPDQYHMPRTTAGSRHAG